MPIGINATGNIWPTELEVSRLDAPSQEYVLDPTLPTLGTDPRFGSDKVVIGRGRLVGVKADASISGDIVTGVAHKSILTVADAKTVRPLGYAKSNYVRDWAQRPSGVMPDISRNMLIAVPYIAAINGANGALAQGDAVTAHASIDPRMKGAIVKFVPQGVYQLTMTGSAISTGCPEDLDTPLVIAAVSSAGAAVDNIPAVYTFAKSGGFHTISGTSGDVVWLSFGHKSHMKAGDVWGMESINDMPGFMKWVETNYGAWMIPPMFKPEGNSVQKATLACESDNQPTGRFALKDGSTLLTQHIDGSKPIYVKAKNALKKFNPVTGAYDIDVTDESILPRSSFSTADYTTGENYMIDVFNGTIAIFGLVQSDGTPVEEGDFTVDAYVEDLKIQPAYATGIYGFGDGNASHAGTPQSYLRDSLIPGTAGVSVGVMRVAIL